MILLQLKQIILIFVKIITSKLQRLEIFFPIFISLSQVSKEIGKFMVKINMLSKQLAKDEDQNEETYKDVVDWDSFSHVLPYIVMATPAMLTKTETKFTKFMESSPNNALIRSVKSPEVENNIVVLATLVLLSAAFIQYCKK